MAIEFGTQFLHDHGSPKFTSFRLDPRFHCRQCNLELLLRRAHLHQGLALSAQTPAVFESKKRECFTFLGLKSGELDDTGLLPGQLQVEFPEPPVNDLA